MNFPESNTAAQTPVLVIFFMRDPAGEDETPARTGQRTMPTMCGSRVFVSLSQTSMMMTGAEGTVTRWDACDVSTKTTARQWRGRRPLSQRTRTVEGEIKSGAFAAGGTLITMRKFFTETFWALLAKDTESTLTNQEYETEIGAKVADFGVCGCCVSETTFANVLRFCLGDCPDRREEAGEAATTLLLPDDETALRALGLFVG